MRVGPLRRPTLAALLGVGPITLIKTLTWPEQVGRQLQSEPVNRLEHRRPGPDAAVGDESVLTFWPLDRRLAGGVYR